MTNQEAERLMRSAWTMRGSSFGAAPEERQALLDQAYQDLKTAADMCRAEGPSVSYAHAIHLLANVELDLGAEREALALWEEAVAVLRTTGDVLQLAHKVRHLGDLHRSCGRLEQAAAPYAEALALYREHDVSGSLDFANAVSRMADLQERLGKVDEAIGLWRETRELYEAADVSAGVEEAERHLQQLRSQGAG